MYSPKIENTYSGFLLEPLSSFLEFMPPKTLDSVYFHDYNENEISDIIANLKSGKASDFPIRVLKKLSGILNPTLVVQCKDVIA